MKILALEPYYGGSHKAFIDGIAEHSSHDWTVLTLPAHKWKWRMRHSAIHFADQAKELVQKPESGDLLFCTDMLNLAEFVALAPKKISALPNIIYFHENQLTYPVRIEDERDYQFAMTNLTSALAADAVWFNSHFHRNSFLKAMQEFLKKMPDYQPLDAVDAIRAKSAVYPPGIEDITPPAERKPGPMRILFSARWEHDKNPEDFFEAVKILKNQGVDFRLSAVGQSFRDVPECFDWAKRHFADHIDYWSYQESRADYETVLRQADVVVSTANHEFFGISIVEAIAAGCYPILPKRLSYPEILRLDGNNNAEQFFYDGTVTALADKLKLLANRIKKHLLWPNKIPPALLTDRFKWKKLTSQYDEAFQHV